jgi:XTP/dITP diphosphohydrolase
MSLLLRNMLGINNRNAKFRTVICLLLDGVEFFFEGECKGSISKKPQGNNGFGYDPIFIPEGYDTTFAEMNDIEKIIISHRTNAANKLKRFLTEKRFK